jgi:DNA-binding response OmpR family regulator
MRPCCLHSEITLNGLNAELSSAPLILLAEDNPADVFLLERALNKHLEHFELRVCADGEKAVRFIEAVDGDESAAPPALILADLNLPRKGGLELLQFVRNSRRSGRVPFLILTSSDSPVDRTETARFGATGYFCKPSGLAEFMEIGRVIKEALAGEPA